MAVSDPPSGSEFSSTFSVGKPGRKSFTVTFTPRIFVYDAVNPAEPLIWPKLPGQSSDELYAVEILMKSNKSSLE